MLPARSNKCDMKVLAVDLLEIAFDYLARLHSLSWYGMFHDGHTIADGGDPAPVYQFDSETNHLCTRVDIDKSD